MCMCILLSSVITELCSGLYVMWVNVSHAQCHTEDDTYLHLGQTCIWRYLPFCKGDAFFLLLYWTISPVCVVSLKAEVLFLLQMHTEQMHFPSILQNKLVCLWKNVFFPQHMCSHFMDQGRVCGAQKSYCCCTEGPVQCPLSSSPSFSHSGSGLRLCCSGSACAAAALAFCLCQRELGHLEERDCGMTRTLLSHTRENLLLGEWIIECLYTRKRELPRRSCSPARGEDAESYTQK